MERRAFKQAVFAVRDEEAALDIVQDAMLRLAQSYGDRGADELAPLFQRILQNAIRDWYRRQKVRSLFNGVVEAGTHSVTWDGLSDAGQPVPGGVYYAVMTSGHFQQPVKMTLVK